jgi:IS1 family transposase
VLRELLWQLKDAGVSVFRTDRYPAYKGNIPSGMIEQTKRKTFTAESKNSQLRQYIPLIKRKTKGYPRSVDALFQCIKLGVYKINVIASKNNFHQQWI